MFHLVLCVCCQRLLIIRCLAATGKLSVVAGQSTSFQSRESHGMECYSITHYVFSWTLLKSEKGNNLTSTCLHLSVKVKIKSFRVPELFIELPETATVGSLKVIGTDNFFILYSFFFFFCFGLFASNITNWVGAFGGTNFAWLKIYRGGCLWWHKIWTPLPEASEFELCRVRAIKRKYPRGCDFFMQFTFLDWNKKWVLNIALLFLIFSFNFCNI